MFIYDANGIGAALRDWLNKEHISTVNGDLLPAYGIINPPNEKVRRELRNTSLDKKICYEVHGEQHYKFVPFYHNNMLTFLKAQARDRDKEEWCLHNNIKYIVLSYEEPDEIWYERIKNA